MKNRRKECLNYGIEKFLSVKKLNGKEVINGFLESENVLAFDFGNKRMVNEYIQKHFTKFASFCDKGIKNGDFKGLDVKLNSYYDERKEYRERVKKEYESMNLSKLQKDILKYISKNFNNAGFLQSFLNKKGIIKTGGKNLEYFSKTLQWIDVVNLAIENGFGEEELKIIYEKDKI